MVRNVYTVRQVNAYIKNMFAQDYMLNRIYVKGEVSNCKYHTSGHIYFSLKDESGTIACVMFAGQRGGLSFRLKEGQQVVVLGSVNVYERSGSYQLYAREIRLDGEGLLYEQFQILKKELEEMGMFAPEYKQQIPAYVKTIGVVTAPTGAAVRDIMNISARRNPYVRLILYPAQVQGDGAAESIVRGIEMLERIGVDLMIVGRGGGSIEDLWAFNEETVARAIFNCSVPVISAVGHETDTTIADYVADLRAPTPSAAAELAVWDYRPVLDHMLECQDKLNGMLEQKIAIERMRVDQFKLWLAFQHPSRQLYAQQQRLADIEDQLREMMGQSLAERKQKTTDLGTELYKGMDQQLQQTRYRLAINVEKMNGLSPIRKLNQGYSYVENQKLAAVKSIRQVQPQDRLSIHVADGVICTIVESVKEENHGGQNRDSCQ